MSEAGHVHVLYMGVWLWREHWKKDLYLFGFWVLKQLVSVNVYEKYDMYCEGVKIIVEKNMVEYIVTTNITLFVQLHSKK